MLSDDIKDFYLEEKEIREFIMFYVKVSPTTLKYY